MNIRHLVVLFAPFFFTTSLCAQQGPASPTTDSSPQAISIGSAIDLYSDVLQERRPIRVYVPDSYEGTSLQYPVVYVLDGEVAFLHTASAVQFLALNGLMPEALVVAVHNTDRMRDMPVPSAYGEGGEEAFLRFLREDLIPYIDATYRTQPLRILSGHSQGGLFTTYDMASHTDAFQWYVPIDAPLFGPVDYLKERVIDLVQQPGYQGRLVTVERTLGWLDDWAALEAVAPPAFVHARLEVSGETHQTMTFEGTYKALKHLFSDYAPDDITTKNLETLLAEYADRSAQYGYALTIPRRLLARNIDDLLFQMRGEEAQALLTHLTDHYGVSESTRRLQERVDEIIAEGPLDETVEDILNYPSPSPEEMAPYLGTWEGRIETQFPVETVVTFAMEDGKAVGYVDLTLPRGEPRRFDVVMIRVLDDGSFEWGYMNQMRPRGVLVNTGQRDTPDTITGTQTMRGVKMKFPPGFTMPLINFTLTRRPE